MRLKIVSVLFIILFQIHCLALAPRSDMQESWKDYNSIQSLLKMNLSGPISHFKALADRILADTRTLSDEEISQVASQLGMNRHILSKDLESAKGIAYYSLFFAQKRLNDDSRNLFLLRDGISLYAAAKLLGRDADTFYVSKAFLEKAYRMTYLQITLLVQKTKADMGYPSREMVPAEKFQEFKTLLFSRIYQMMNEEKQDPSTAYKFLPAAEMILNFFAQFPENLSGQALRLIDTTMTGNIVLLIESLLQMTPAERKSLALPDFQIQGNITSLMFCSTLSPALGLTSNENTGRAVEFTTYPIEFDYFDKQTSMPIMRENFQSSKQRFILDFILLRNEMLKILNSPEAPQLPNKNSPTRTSS